MTSTIRTYSELILLSTFEERYEYLKIGGRVGVITFGGHRELNQTLYHCDEWRTVRREIIIRDNGCDLADDDRQIQGRILVHHLNPITIDDILQRRANVFDPENLVCCSFKTHQAIHYGALSMLPTRAVSRQPNDTCPWR